VKDAEEKLAEEEKQSLQDKYDKLVKHNKELQELLKVHEEYSADQMDGEIEETKIDVLRGSSSLTLGKLI
jgi:hypothetical protein